VSFTVLVVPEDPTYNGYILRPLVTRILRECGRPNAKVTVLTSPKADGYAHAKRLLVQRVLDLYSHFDLVLFLPDADGHDRTAEFTALEALGDERDMHLMCCAAVEEVEAWLLAGHVDKLSQNWAAVRRDVSVKENVFAPFLAKHGDARRAGGGRDLLMQETLQNYSGLLQRCPELAALEQRIRALLASD